MNEVIKNIYQRRAVRKYKHVEVPREIIEQLISAGRMAPSAMNRQPWKFYVVTDAKLAHRISNEIAHIAIKEIKHVSLKELAKMTLSSFHLSKMIDFLKSDDHIFYNAPVVLFITSPVADEWGALDVGMCAQNIMLAAKSMGLDSCPIGFAKFAMQAPSYYLLDIPATEQLNLAIVIGYGDEQPEMHERIENNVVYI